MIVKQKRLRPASRRPVIRRTLISVAIASALAAAGSYPETVLARLNIAPGKFPARLEMSSLNGVNGFVINGVAGGDRSGISVSVAGDINGDGIEDVIVGASSGGSGFGGESYVVFGNINGFPAELDLTSLNGVNGFSVRGEDSTSSGFSVSAAGDVNDDGVDDLIIGAFNASPASIVNAGSSYVVFGNSNGFSAGFDASDLGGSNGFTITGSDSGDSSGLSVSSAGDFNGDGLGDLIIGAPSADRQGKNNIGVSYLVFGNSNGFPSRLNVQSLNGNNGFEIMGIDMFDGSGSSVSGAGDVNDDGLDDLIIGASGGDPNGNAESGESYVIFGVETPLFSDGFEDFGFH